MTTVDTTGVESGAAGLVFYTGTHHPHWLWQTDMPLFVSRRQLVKRAVRGLRPTTCRRWALDSGGFKEIEKFGRWTVTPVQYIDMVATWVERIGRMDFAAPMDWMCEPVMLAKTGLSVRDHQERTVVNYLELRALAPALPFVPVLQGWTPADYLACIDLYAAAGVDLTAQSLVGLGSVCRRQSTREIAALVRELASLGLRLHGFGVKTQGLARYASHLTSADSLAWSTRARHSLPLPGHEVRHKNCANCLTYATAWTARLRTGLNVPVRHLDPTDREAAA